MSNADIETEPHVLRVHSKLSLLGGRTRLGPCFEVSAVKQMKDGGWLWEAQPMWKEEGPVEVEDADFESEPLLCLAARGAWNLWGSGPSLRKQSDCNGLSVQVVYGGLTIAAVAVIIDERGATYSGWTLEPTLRLSLTQDDCPGERDPEHWLSRVLTLVVFGEHQPPGEHAKFGALPLFWKERQLPGIVSLVGGPDALRPEICGDYLFLTMFEYDD